MMRSGISKKRYRSALAWVSLLIWGCPEPPEPVFDETIGVQAVATEPGVLAGTFALKTISTTLVHVPMIGDVEGGGSNYRLVKRTYDSETDTYHQTSQLCGGANFEVAGVLTTIPESTYRAVPESEDEVIKVDHELGTYEADGHLQLWGIKDLPDPHTTPLPEDGEAATLSPHAERIYDMDEDGHPGMTMVVSGLVSGEVYAIQRKTVTLEGVVLSPDRILGLADNAYQSIVLDKTNPLLDPSGGSSERHPDLKESWFEEVRVEDGVACDFIMSAEEQGLLSRIRPF